MLFFVSLSAAPSYASLDLNDKTANNLTTNTFFNDPSLQAYYKLENTSDSKGSNTLANNNSVSFNAAKFNNGADFGSTNTNKYLSTSSALVANGNISISAWVKLNSEITSDSWIFVSQVSTTNQVAYHLVYDYNGGTRRVRFIRTRNGIADDSISYNITLGTSNWYHLTLTYDGSTMKMYVNGVEQASGNYSGSGNTGATNAFVIGSNYSGLANYASAVIDDVAVFNKKLAPAEVSNLYNSTGEFGLTLNDTDMEITTSLPFGNSSKAVNLSGYQYLTAPDSASLSITSKATIEFWIKFNSLPASGNTMYLVSKRDDAGSDSGYGFGLRNSGGTLQLVGVANQSADSSNRDVYKWDWTPSTGTWYHLALTTDATQVSASTFKLFVDGTSQGNGDALITDNISSIRDADSPFLIGCELQVGTTANCADAKFDDVRIWEVVRSDSEIANNRSIELTGREPGFAAYYPMEPL